MSDGDDAYNERAHRQNGRVAMLREWLEPEREDILSFWSALLTDVDSRRLRRYIRYISDNRNPNHGQWRGKA